MKIRHQQHQRSAGFSLIEMLITIALIIVLSVMLTGRGSRSFQQQQIANCDKNLQTIFTILSIYASERNETFPASSDATSSEKPLSLLVPKWTATTTMFICPGTKASPLPQGEPFADRQISYAYYMGYDKKADGSQPLVTDCQINTARKKQGNALFSSDGKGLGSNHDKFGGNLLFCDGSVRKSKPASEYDLFFPTNVTLLNPRP